MKKPIKELVAGKGKAMKNQLNEYKRRFPMRTAVALKQEGPWTIGVLANHLWSVAGEDDVIKLSSSHSHLKKYK